MTNFRDAFRVGQAAAAASEAARLEIQDVIQEVSAALSEETGGKILFEKQKVKKSAANALLALSRGESDTYDVLVAVAAGDTDAPDMHLARWQEDARGYPCQVTWGSRDQICLDREGLERALAALLSDPLVAEKIRMLL